MKEINCLSKILSSKHGNFSQHLEFLKDKIIYADKIFSLNDDQLTDVQKLIKNFCLIIDGLISDSTVQNLDSDFFMKHIRNILSSFEASDEVEDKNIKISIQSMLNLKHYKHVIFMGLENNKYPREHKQKFPFTPEIIKAARYLGMRSYTIDVHDNNLIMENFFFKNVIDFTDKEIWFTCTKIDKKAKSKFSIYADEITTLFDSDVNFCLSQKFSSNKSRGTHNDVSTPLFLSSQKEYSLKELITFQLCPKLYYHKYDGSNRLSYKTEKQLKLYAESVLFYGLFDKFKKYNFENKKWYSASNHEVYKVLEFLSEENFKEHAKNFSFLNFPKLVALKEKTVSRIINFIENYIIDNLEYYNYTIVNSEGQVYPVDDFTVKLGYDTAVFCKNKKNSKVIFQNDTYLDFLTLKCTQQEVHEKHYKDMVYKLQEKNKYTDRIFLANRMLSKINIQFASGVKRFIHGNDGGVERVVDLKNKITETDFFKIFPRQSNFCDYCIVRNICMGGKETAKVLEVIE